jgi:hypothetical protein
MIEDLEKFKRIGITRLGGHRPTRPTRIAALSMKGHRPHGQGTPPAAISDKRLGLMGIVVMGVFHRKAPVRRMNITRTETTNELPCCPTQACSP